MKFFKRKKGKEYPEMVDTIHSDPEEDMEMSGDAEPSDPEAYEGESRETASSEPEFEEGLPKSESGYEEEVLDSESGEELPESEPGYEEEVLDSESGEKLPESESGYEEEAPDSELGEELPKSEPGYEEEALDSESGEELPEPEPGFEESDPDSGEEMLESEPSDTGEVSGWEEQEAFPGQSLESSAETGGQEQASAGEMSEQAPEEEAWTDPEVLSERDLARKARMKRRRREMRRVHFMIGLFVLFILAGGCAAGYWILSSQGIEIRLDSLGDFLSGRFEKDPAAADGNAGVNTADQPAGEEGDNADAPAEPAQTEKVTETQAPTVSAEVIAQADLMAAQYDYDRAAELLKAQPEYGTDTLAQQKTAEYEASKAACVEISPDTVSHVFVHSLIVDPTRAFDGDENQQGYNKNMVTLDEFKKIIQSMYDNGYVLVSLHDMGEIDANGKMQRKSIWLPEGKKPVIFSQDDVSYYHSYENDGFPDRLIVDENGDVKNEYTDTAGNTTVGDYDMVPVLDTFIKEHPDFSYRGRKGIVVLTGYNGVLGYHTDGDYRDKLSLQEDQARWLEEHPEFDFDADVAAATKVADAMKAAGWEFASHTWGHISVSEASLERLQTDTQKWLDYVEPIVGKTDMIIFAFGSDIGDWTGYSADNEKFNYLKSVGFNYFCNVDGSSLSWVQFGETYLRTGRMNIDGYRMSSNPEILAPLFDVSQVYDYENRPEMEEWSQ